MRRVVGVVAGAAALLALPPAAKAQPGPIPWYERQDKGVEAQALAGLVVFPGAASDFLGTGLAYGVLVTIEPWSLVSFELSYQGALYQTTSLASDADLSVFENGGQAAVKLSPRLDHIEPYALAGFGFASVEVVEEVGTRSRVQDDTLLQVPLALGADWHFADEADEGAAHLTLGARASWIFVFDNELVPVSARGADKLLLALVFGVQF